MSKKNHRSSKNSSNVPAAQALQFTIERALNAITWLKEMKQERQEQCDARQDASTPALRLRLLTDLVSVYISALVEKGGNGHSALKSYPEHNLVKSLSQ